MEIEPAVKSEADAVKSIVSAHAAADAPAASAASSVPMMIFFIFNC